MSFVKWNYALAAFGEVEVLEENSRLRSENEALRALTSDFEWKPYWKTSKIRKGVPSWPQWEIIQVELEQLMALTVVQKLRILEMWHFWPWNRWQRSFGFCLISSVGDKLDKLKAKVGTGTVHVINLISAPCLLRLQTWLLHRQEIVEAGRLHLAYLRSESSLLAPIWHANEDIAKSHKGDRRGIFLLVCPYFLFLRDLSTTLNVSKRKPEVG